MVFAIEPNLTRANAYEVTREVCHELDKLGAKYLMTKENKENFSDTGASFFNKKEIFSKADIFIAIGGDGTIIRCAKEALQFNKPVLGINAGRLAFMAGLERHEIHLLKNLLTGEYCVEKRMLLKTVLTDGEKLFASDYCVNDTVVTRPGRAKLLEIKVERHGKRLIKYYADGLIISTPTGSTAYSLSAGGPIIDPELESIMLTPICAHSLFARPFVLNSDSEICIKVPEEEEVIYFCDGGEAQRITANSHIMIKKSELSADFIRIKPDTFVDVLNSKLTHWNGNF
ncbi:MAG TPA: NAD(+)/NADH kinase [Clostridiales bacterium]|nr:NAD(+)/NADH kinase [Clostridiales bacterium]HRT81679.1 NAD(+)/NADH kinase [Oscillospiraceae bacterium]